MVKEIDKHKLIKKFLLDIPESIIYDNMSEIEENTLFILEKYVKKYEDGTFLHSEDFWNGALMHSKKEGLLGLIFSDFLCENFHKCPFKNVKIAVVNDAINGTFLKGDEIKLIHFLNNKKNNINYTDMRSIINCRISDDDMYDFFDINVYGDQIIASKDIFTPDFVRVCLSDGFEDFNDIFYSILSKKDLSDITDGFIDVDDDIAAGIMNNANFNENEKNEIFDNFSPCISKMRYFTNHSIKKIIDTLKDEATNELYPEDKLIEMADIWNCVLKFIIRNPNKDNINTVLEFVNEMIENNKGIDYHEKMVYHSLVKTGFLFEDDSIFKATLTYFKNESEEGLASFINFVISSNKPLTCVQFDAIWSEIEKSDYFEGNDYAGLILGLIHCGIKSSTSNVFSPTFCNTIKDILCFNDKKSLFYFSSSDKTLFNDEEMFSIISNFLMSPFTPDGDIEDMAKLILNSNNSLSDANKEKLTDVLLWRHILNKQDLPLNLRLFPIHEKVIEKECSCNHILDIDFNKYGEKIKKSFDAFNQISKNEHVKKIIKNVEDEFRVLDNLENLLKEDLFDISLFKDNVAYKNPFYSSFGTRLKRDKINSFFVTPKKSMFDDDTVLLYKETIKSISNINTVAELINGIRNSYATDINAFNKTGYLTIAALCYEELKNHQTYLLSEKEKIKNVDIIKQHNEFAK